MTGARIGDALADVVAGGHLAGGAALGSVVGFAVGSVGRRTRQPAPRPAISAGVVVSLVAVGGAYACTPDTELARGVLGAVLGAGVAAVRCGLRWWWPSTAISSALVVVAVADGAGRASAVVGALAVAALHLAAQDRLRRGARPTAVLVVVALAVAACSRVAGLATSAERAALVAGAALVAAGVALAAAPRH